MELLEATPHLGGHLRDVVRLPGLAEWGRVISWRETQLNKLANVTVRRGVGMVTADDLLEYGVDRVVLATGAHWAADGSGALGPDPIPASTRPRRNSPRPSRSSPARRSASACWCSTAMAISWA